MISDLEDAKKISEKDVVTKDDMNKIDNLLSNVEWNIRKEFWSTVYCDGCGEVSTKRISGYSICDKQDCFDGVIGE